MPRSLRINDMTHDSPHAPHPRSKLEYLYRDLLIECDQLTQRQHALGEQLRETAASLQTTPTLLRQAAGAISHQASGEALRSIERANNALKAANDHLLLTHQALRRASDQNVRTLALVAGACGMLGGLLGAVIATLALLP